MHAEEQSDGIVAVDDERFDTLLDELVGLVEDFHEVVRRRSILQEEEIAQEEILAAAIVQQGVLFAAEEILVRVLGEE